MTTRTDATPSRLRYTNIHILIARLKPDISIPLPTGHSYFALTGRSISQKLAFEMHNGIVEAERSVPGLLPLEERMNARYERFGQRWQPKDMTQPIVNGIRIYMALKGSPAPRGAAAADAQRAASATGGVSPDITWDSGYTEAPDETAHGN